MKTFFGCLREDLHRAFGSWMFLLAAVGTCVACILPYWEAVFTQGPVWGGYILWHQVLTFDPFYNFLFLVLACLPYSAAFCSDWDNRYIRSLCIRTGPSVYGASKTLACALAGWSASFLGRAGYFALCMLLSGGHMEHPEYGLSSAQSDAALSGGFSPLLSNGEIPGILLYILLIILVQSLYAGCFAAMSLMVSSFLPNIFVTLASPVILIFVTDGIMTLLNFPLYLYPEVVGNCQMGGLAMGGVGTSFLYAAAFFAALTALFGCLFTWKIGRRLDRG